MLLSNIRGRIILSGRNLLITNNETGKYSGLALGALKKHPTQKIWTIYVKNNRVHVLGI